MDDITTLEERTIGTLQSPVLVIIEHLALTRTCILNILNRVLVGFEIIELAKADDLNCMSGRNVRLIVLGIGDKPIIDPSIEHDLALIAQSCPHAFVAVLSNRDDEATAVAAIQHGVRGFFPTSIPVELAIAGLRLVLAGGIYRPLPPTRQDKMPRFEYFNVPDQSVKHGVNGFRKDLIEKTVVHFTPREQHVLAELQLGLPNKLIAAKLNLSENTVKMHIKHIMRKFAVHNRTEAVLCWRTLIES